MKKVLEMTETVLRHVLGTKIVLIITVTALLLILLRVGSVSSALGQGNDWTIEGNCVYWNNSKGDVQVCPHTLSGSGWAYFNATSYLPSSFNLDVAFGITENIVPSKPQIWANISHPVLVSNCTVSQISIVNNGTLGTENRTTCNPYYAQNYYLDWQDVGGFSTTQYDGKIWYARSAAWNAGETKSGRVWLDVKPMSGKSKYSVLVKKASDTFAQAEANGNYVLLDPWVDSPPAVFNETFDNGQFVNASLTSLNISRGWLILNMSGVNSTTILDNTSALGGHNCWNGSADAGSSGGPETSNYNCGNLQDGQADFNQPANVWAATDGTVPPPPQFIAIQLPRYVWMTNFSYQQGTADSSRTPANWSIQISDTTINRATAAGPGSDGAANWLYAQFNKTNNAGNAPNVDGITFAPTRTTQFRWHITNKNGGGQIFINELYAYSALFSTFGNMTSVILNDTITVDKVNVTCVNTTGAETGVGMNITVMDRNYANEQTVQCNSDSAKGFENDIANIDGLIYRVNFSSKHSGITPELDFLTLRVKEASGSSSATEAQGDTAIEVGINSSIPSATKYSSQQVYVRNLSNNQTLGTFDWVASYGSQRWLFNYVTAGESYVNAPNLTTAVYVLEVADKTSAQITDEVSKFINATKS